MEKTEFVFYDVCTHNGVHNIKRLQVKIMGPNLSSQDIQSEYTKQYMLKHDLKALKSKQMVFWLWDHRTKVQTYTF